MKNGKTERSKSFGYLIVSTDESDLLTCIIWEEGTLGVEVLEDRCSGGKIACKAYFETEESRDRCRQRIDKELPEADVTESGSEVIDDWISLLHGGFEPVAAGPLLVVPAHAPPPSIPGAGLLKINPGLGFGTGTHPTTRMTLELLCEQIRPGARVCDVGTGSGILAIAAALLGASEVLAVDIDADAIENASGNLRINGVEEKVELRHGSIELAAGRTFHLVLANIFATILIGLLQRGLADIVAPGGSLVLSGFDPVGADRLRTAVEAAGMEYSELRTSGDWAAMLAVKRER